MVLELTALYHNVTRSTRSPPFIDTCNPIRVTSTLPASQLEIQYLIEEIDEEGKEGEWATGSLTDWTKCNSGAATSHWYSVRAWYITGRANPILCCSQVDITSILQLDISAIFAQVKRSRAVVVYLLRSYDGLGVGRYDYVCGAPPGQPARALPTVAAAPLPVLIERVALQQQQDNQKSIDARNAWIKTDRKAKSEVILAISSTELQHVRGCNTSREVWQKLASVYASKGPARKALLLKQLMLHKMSEGGDVRDHVNKFSDIVDRLGAMDIQVNKDLLSIMLLFSLPDSYEGFKCAIESRDELLEVEALKVKILEKSEVGSNSVVELAGSVRTENQKSYKYEFNGYCFKCGKQGHKSPECPTQSKPNKPNFRRNGPDKQNKQYRQEKQCAQADDDTLQYIILNLLVLFQVVDLGYLTVAVLHIYVVISNYLSLLMKKLMEESIWLVKLAVKSKERELLIY
ncbi:Retrovirus-related Pol polyprotein from transposon TNT 1-94 [Eumeta japonica]|uniref:Retrovirus-related Pol polyprotein from transposon TNT 1-94 n=2 Tax=Eumeta variegata TaxID=151549 RepID=A0A4C1WLZ2_EUMVA|nr:Retrovirus-related Pol polyprotein from transposon TNT 1-94 [Eumeta japonica]